MLLSPLTAEAKRLEALASYDILDTLPEADYDAITQIAAHICQTPISLIALVDEQRQWFKSTHGLVMSQTPRDVSFCDYTIQTPGQLMEISDAQRDERFATNPFVTGEPHIVFYAGIPLVDADGYALGALCVLDHQARQLSDQQATVLNALARQVVTQLQLRRSQHRLATAGQTLQTLNAELQNSNQVLKTVIDTCPAGLVLWQAVRNEETIVDFRYVFTNPVNAVLEGLPGDEMREQSLKNVFPDVVSSGLFERLVGVVETNQPQRYQQQRGLLDQTAHWGDVTLTPCGDGVLFTAQDITQLKETEQQLRTNSDKLNQLVAERTAEIHQLSTLNQAILRHAGMAIISTDIRGLIQTVNPATEKLLGYPASELIGTSPLRLHYLPQPQNQAGATSGQADQTVPRPEVSLLTLLADNQAHECVLLSRQGCQIPVLLVRSALHDEKGTVTGYVSMATDITARKDSERILQQSLQREQDLNKLKSQFVTTASHEFRTPLATIQSSVELIKVYMERISTDGPPAIHRHLGIIEKQIVGFSDLLSDVLSIGKVEAGRISYNPQLLDAVALVADVVDTHYGERQDGRSVHRSITGQPRPVRVDGKLITHILVNLLSNAFKFSTLDPHLHIVFEEHQFSIQITDKGVGIPAAELPQLFDTFFRASNVGSVSGTGLGLVIARHFAELHGGQLVISSEEHAGTTSTLCLPTG